MGRGEARERAQFSLEAETEQSGLCDAEALVGISPVAAVVKAQAGTAVKGAERPAACGGLPLTGGPGCAIPCGAAGVYPPEPPPFP